MSELLLYISPLAAGLLVGYLYFCGLWFTLQQMSKVRQPHLLILVSFISRISIMLLVLYLVADGHWTRLGLYLLGFFIMRISLLKRWGPRVFSAASERKVDGTKP